MARGPGGRSFGGPVRDKNIRSAILSHTTPDSQLSGKVVHPGVLNVAAALASVP